MIEKKTIPQALVEQLITKKLRDKRERFCKILRNTNREQHLIKWKKARAEFWSLAKENKNEDWEKFASSLSSNAPINQAWNRVRQMKAMVQNK